jgi:hypothetical protein
MPESRTFHYLPPALEEWRAFWIQLSGSIAALAIVGLWLAPRADVPSAILGGVLLGTVYIVWRTLQRLRQKLRRANRESITIDDHALTLTDERGQQQTLPWRDIHSSHAQGNTVVLTWQDGSWSFSPRDVEDGTTLAREIAHRRAKAHGEWAPPANFIPLTLQ